MKQLLALFLTLLPSALAQTDGISAPVSRTITLAAEEASIGITVAAALDSTQQQVKQALQDAGLPNPTVVATGLAQNNSTYPPSGAQMLYSATVTIPAGSATDAAKRLEALRTHLPAPLQSLQYSVAFNPSQSTIDAMRQTVLPQLLDASRRQAQSLAAAAGVRVGGIRALSDVAGSFSQSPPALGRIFDPATGVPFPLSNTQYTFFLSVVFATAP